MAVRKGKKQRQSASGIKLIASGDAPLRFSFRFFDNQDEEVCPPIFRDGYTQKLMDRLQSISTWTVKQFITAQGKSIRNHMVDWDQTARPQGFANLPVHLQDYPARQFSISANEYGRVFGLLIDDTFHIIWLDMNHMVYQ